MTDQSLRSKIIMRRSYNRPKEDGTFETWDETVDRVISHQRWLWERAKGRKLGVHGENELEELRKLILDRKAIVSGRTLWLGGTETAKRREASQFNCSFLKIETVHDVVDVQWLLLQGCGVGVKPVAGVLNGFSKPIHNVEYIRSNNVAKGREGNVETWDNETKTWTIGLGDSAEAWAKIFGKLLAGKYPADKLVIDFSQVRPSGTRLKGYGWISSGDNAIYVAIRALIGIMNNRAGQLLTTHDIHDIINWLGTILSSRRSSEIVLYDYGTPGWETFASFKKDFWIGGNDHRQQSNNSLLFWSKPSRQQIRDVFQVMIDSGGSEPGFINASAATARAPWFSGVNPCGEILLSNKSFCNLVEVNIGAYKQDPSGLNRAMQVISRANYRQTCVNLRDGILQSAWHENNEFLRLCGVGLTGIATRPDLSAYDYRALKNAAVAGAYGMADELGLPRPKNVTTIKPSGTLSKIMDTSEGAHLPLGKYIFNNVKFSSHDPIVKLLRKSGYRVIDSPIKTDTDTVLITLPVAMHGIPLTKVNGLEVNLESAVDQLNRYKMLMDNYVEHNCSITVSYDPNEVEEIVDWIDKNWDHYVGVSFLFRTDPTKSAKDLGYDYLPQEVVTQEVYDKYCKLLKPIDLNEKIGAAGEDEGCATGACPIQ